MTHRWYINWLGMPLNKGKRNVGFRSHDLRCVLPKKWTLTHEHCVMPGLRPHGFHAPSQVSTTRSLESNKGINRWLAARVCAWAWQRRAIVSLVRILLVIEFLVSLCSFRDRAEKLLDLVWLGGSVRREELYTFSGSRYLWWSTKDYVHPLENAIVLLSVWGIYVQPQKSLLLG